MIKSIFGCSNYSKSAIFAANLEKFNGFILPFRAAKYSGKLKLLENKLLVRPSNLFFSQLIYYIIYIMTFTTIIEVLNYYL